MNPKAEVEFFYQIKELFSLELTRYRKYISGYSIVYVKVLPGINEIAAKKNIPLDILKESAYSFVKRFVSDVTKIDLDKLEIIEEKSGSTFFAVRFRSEEYKNT